MTLSLRAPISGSSVPSSCLRAANGKPVGFDALRADGVPLPAAIISELELSGYPLERVRDHGRLLGVRLLSDVTPTPTADQRSWMRRRRQR
jgi:hypothetical protein